MSPAGDSVIHIVAAIAIDARGDMLLVRKRGTAAFMLPGGKRGEGEPAEAALARECLEELGCAPDPGSFRRLGIFRAPAANEDGFIVEAELFAVRLPGEARPSGEIEELAWIDPDGPIPYPLALLALDHALPLARALRNERTGLECSSAA